MSPSEWPSEWLEKKRCHESFPPGPLSPLLARAVRAGDAVCDGCGGNRFDPRPAKPTNNGEGRDQ